MYTEREMYTLTHTTHTHTHTEREGERERERERCIIELASTSTRDDVGPQKQKDKTSNKQEKLTSTYWSHLCAPAHIQSARRG